MLGNDGVLKVELDGATSAAFRGKNPEIQFKRRER
jgi:hypothetical protein